MEYELAKELKDAGFPQKVDASSGVDKLLGGVPYVPTLSELIEACGDRFYRLTKDGVNGFCCEDITGDFHTCGKTCEEAVGKLWLALNKISKA